MEYLGSLGRLVGFRCASSERVGAEPRYSVETTVEGRRFAQATPTAARTWDVTWGARQNPELAKLSAFTSGAWGSGPWHWVSVQAQQGNLLTPREAGLLEFGSSASLSAAGPIRGADGEWAARSVSASLSTGWVEIVRDIPVVAGTPVTFALDVLGSEGDALVLQFRDESGATLLGVYGGEVTAQMSRTSMTVAAPEGAVSARVGVRPGVARFARPQVTWTAGPVPYSAGHGCRMAVVDGFSEDLIVANRSGTYSSAGFTVMEVG